jgi:hypothetical protein
MSNNPSEYRAAGRGGERSLSCSGAAKADDFLPSMHAFLPSTHASAAYRSTDSFTERPSQVSA